MKLSHFYRIRFIFKAGLAVLVFCLSACSSGSQEEVEVPGIMIDMRTELAAETRVKLPEPEEKQSQEPAALEEAASLPPKVAEKKIAEEKPVGKVVLSTAEYRNLPISKRYEYLPEFQKENNKVLKLARDKDIADTIIPKHKPLVLGGKGFGIAGFENKAETSLPVNFEKHISIEEPVYHEESVEKLDLALDNVRQKKPLIFHAKATGFDKASHVSVGLEIPDPLPEPPPNLEPIPETRLVLSQGDESLLLLDPSEQQLDLLRGNETLNKDDYYQALR